jgi:hypothetical protein
MTSKNKNIRHLHRWIKEFKNGYQPSKDENGYQLAYSHNILRGWKIYFSQLLNAHNITDVGLT